jgi:hypothetical protein
MHSRNGRAVKGTEKSPPERGGSRALALSRTQHWCLICGSLTHSARQEDSQLVCPESEDDLSYPQEEPEKY